MSVLSDEFYYQPITIDTINTQVFTNLFAKENDANGRGLLVTVTENGLVKNTTGISLNLKWEHTLTGGQGLDIFTPVDLTKGIYKITYPAEMNHQGMVRAFIQILDTDRLVGSRNLKIIVEPSVGDDGAIESLDSFTALTEAILAVQEIRGSTDPTLQSAIQLPIFKKLETDVDDTERMQRVIDYCAAQKIPLVLNGGTFTLCDLIVPAGVAIYGNGALFKKPNLSAAPYNLTVAEMKWKRMVKVTYSGSVDSDVTSIDGITFDGNCWEMWTVPSFDQEQASCLFASASSTLPGRLRLKISNCHFRNNVSDGVHVYTNVIFQADNCTSSDCFRGGLVLTGGNTDATVDGWVFNTIVEEMRDGVDVEIDSDGYGGSYEVHLSFSNMMFDDDFDVAIGSNSTLMANNITMKSGSWDFYSKGKIYISNSYLRRQNDDGLNACIAGNGEMVFTNCVLDGGDTTSGIAIPLQVNYETGVDTTGSSFKFNGCHFVNCRYGIGGALLKTNLYLNDCDFDEDCDTAIGYSTGNPHFQPLSIHANDTRFRNYGYALRLAATGSYMAVTQVYWSGNEPLNPNGLGLYVRSPVVHFRDDQSVRWPIVKESGGSPVFYGLKAGATTNMPQDPIVGSQYFDTTVNSMLICKELGTKEVVTFTVTAPATTSGNMTITLNGGINEVAVVAGETAIQVADKFRANYYTSYVTSGDVGTNVVTFTRRTPGVSSNPSYNPWSTGVTATIVQTTAGTANTWVDTSISASQSIIEMDLFVKGVAENDDSARMQRAIDYANANNIPLVLNGGDFTVYSLTVPAGMVIYGNGATFRKPELDAAPYNMTAASMKWIRMVTVSWSNALDSPETIIDGINFQGEAWSMWDTASSAQDQAALLYLTSSDSFAGRLRVKVSNCHFANNVAAGIQTYSNVLFQIDNCSSIDCWRGGFYVSGGYTEGTVNNWTSTSTRTDMIDGINIAVSSSGYGSSNKINIVLNNILVDYSFKVTVPSGGVVIANNVIMKGGTWYLYSTGKLMINNSTLRKDVTDTSSATINTSGEIVWNNCILDGSNTTNGIAVRMATTSASVRTGAFRFLNCRFINTRYGIGSALLEALVFLDNCDFDTDCETAIGYDTGNPDFQPIEVHVSNCLFRNFGYAVRLNAVATFMPLTKLYLTGNKRLNTANLGLYLQSPFVYFQDDEFVRWPITIGGSGAPLYYNLSAGVTARRPQDPQVGQQFFDTTLGKPIFVKTLGTKEVITVVVTGAATGTGNMSLTLGGSSNDIALVAGDTTVQVAAKIRAKYMRLYSVDTIPDTSTVVFTKRYQGTSSAPSYNPWSTGVTITVTVTTAGVANTWMDAAGTTV